MVVPRMVLPRAIARDDVMEWILEHLAVRKLPTERGLAPVGHVFLTLRAGCVNDSWS